MCASLVTLAPDCLANLFQRLDGNDFISLMLTGNRLLRRKLTNNCVDLFFKVLNTTKFPFAALKLAKLRSLEIHGIKSLAMYLDFTIRDELALMQGSKSIEKIDLRFSNSPALFLAPGRSLPRLPIRDRFPSLTTLILHEVICEESLLESLFGELPEILTTFSLKLSEASFCPNLCLSSIANLPRQLKTLKIRRYSIAAPPETDFKFEKVLPPGLTYLRLEDLINIDILNYLPSSLQILRLKPCRSTNLPCWEPSKFPPGLIAFCSDMWSSYRHLSASLPSTLERFESRIPFNREEGFTIEDLPKNLKILPNSLSKPTFDEILTAHMFPRLEKALIRHEETVAHLPESLKTLKCFSRPLRFSSPLPRGLTSLSLCVIPRPCDLDNIPATLTSLKVYGDTLVADQHLGNEFPPWIASDFAQFGSKIHLVDLVIYWKHIESGSSLAPLAKMETLKKFYINGVPWQAALEAPEWLPKCLPKSLTRLDFFSVGTDSVDRESAISKKWALWHLKRVTPHLKSLTLHCFYRLDFNLDQELPSSLPQSLIKLDLYSVRGKVELGAFSHLPRSLQCFTLCFNTTESLSDAHFEGMPPSLAELDINIGYGCASLTAKLFEILPNSISKLELNLLDNENADEEFERRQAEFLRSNPIKIGFLDPDILDAEEDI